MRLDRLQPVCLAGANAYPTEDCVGSCGYAEYVVAMADPKHERNEEMKERRGSVWDAKLFNFLAASAELKRIKA